MTLKQIIDAVDIATWSSSKLLALYFGQKRHYHSSQRNEVLVIAAMAPRHCANAAEKLLREAEMWAQDCAVDTAYPTLWMATTPLFQALAKRGAQEA
jgi:predicted metal-dependent HD superfamily phosphohydrolase